MSHLVKVIYKLYNRIQFEKIEVFKRNNLKKQITLSNTHLFIETGIFKH